MKSLLNIASSVVLGAFLLLPVAAQAQQQAVSLDELLKKVESGRIQESKENRQREKAFAADKSQQAKLLANVKAELAQQEKRSAELDKLFEENDKKIAEAEKRLHERMGTLGELFGHITSAAGDTRGNFENSLVSIDHPGREKFLDNLVKVTSEGTELPSIEQIEGLWFELQREMTEQGKIVRLTADVARGEGTQQEGIVRIGTFNAITDKGEYLKYEAGRLSVLPRQPSGKYVSEAGALAGLQSGFTKVGIDPTGPSGGSLLSALIDTPTIVERWHQGGLVGYVISGIGVLAILLAIFRLIVLSAVSGKVRSQLKSDTPNENNPLGRVLAAAQSNKDADVETMELKLNEAILKELPKLTSGESLLKIIAAVAPLLGLLGTVTGMILTFQAITIYGAGDPKAMAGGISSALITTVLGLIVAIPTILMHTIVAGRSKHIIHVLEEQAAGIVAEHQEG
ncbi:Biopolymer transport protein ExbB [BD1-7 clade bacterium]|uniref:Biopolymer transport protein ExbB n=1 Tax=BD1-7 clade bacterium TaxID=2029982 RepID=A0A5S9MVC8_9GAMM|nr:Biopolymer transport protein ExbB [BD1-7 clade bacterium]